MDSGVSAPLARDCNWPIYPSIGLVGITRGRRKVMVKPMKSTARYRPMRLATYCTTPIETASESGRGTGRREDAAPTDTAGYCLPVGSMLTMVFLNDDHHV